MCRRGVDEKQKKVRYAVCVLYPALLVPFVEVFVGTFA